MELLSELQKKIDAGDVIDDYVDDYSVYSKVVHNGITYSVSSEYDEEKRKLIVISASENPAKTNLPTEAPSSNVQTENHKIYNIPVQLPLDLNIRIKTSQPLDNHLSSVLVAESDAYAEKFGNWVHGLILDNFRSFNPNLCDGDEIEYLNTSEPEIDEIEINESIISENFRELSEKEGVICHFHSYLPDSNQNLFYMLYNEKTYQIYVDCKSGVAKAVCIDGYDDEDLE